MWSTPAGDDLVIRLGSGDTQTYTCACWGWDPTHRCTQCGRTQRHAAATQDTCSTNTKCTLPTQTPALHTCIATHSITNQLYNNKSAITASTLYYKTFFENTLPSLVGKPKTQWGESTCWQKSLSPSAACGVQRRACALPCRHCKN